LLFALAMTDVEAVENLKPDVPGAKELEVLLADIENRLRKTILRIIRPSLDQANELAHQLEDLTSKVDSHDLAIDDAKILRLEVNQQMEILTIMKDQLATQDSQALAFEQDTRKDITEMREFSKQLEHKFEDNHNQIEANRRENVRICGEMARFQSELDEGKKRLWEGVTGACKKCEDIRDEFAERISDVHKQHNALTEDLYGEGKGLVKLGAEIVQLQVFTASLPKIGTDVATLFRKVDDLEIRQITVEDVCKKAQASYAEFTVYIETKLREMNAEFKMSVNQLVAHHASLMKIIKKDFQIELTEAKNLRVDMETSKVNMTKYCHDLADDVIAGSKRLDVMHKNIVLEIEELRKRHKRDCQGHDVELKEMRRDMSAHLENVKCFESSLAYHSHVLGLVLESERVTSALHVQDYADRIAERWLGPPADLGRRAQPAYTAEMLEQLPRHEMNGGRCSGNPSMHKLVPVDAFKGLAKLEYVPGSVQFGGCQYDRRDVLLLHHKLLHKAHAAFQKGPPREVETFVAGFDIAPRQPAANGGIPSSTHSRVPVSRAKQIAGDDYGFGFCSEDPKSTAASTATGTHRGSTGSNRPGSQGQRPGSQGQPQGTGSRGTMFGSLGETEPPADSYWPEGLNGIDEILTGQSRSEARLRRPEGPLDSIKGSFRLPAISGNDAPSGASLNGSSSVREQPSATEIGVSSATARKCQTAR